MNRKQQRRVLLRRKRKAREEKKTDTQSKRDKGQKFDLKRFNPCGNWFY